MKPNHILIRQFLYGRTCHMTIIFKEDNQCELFLFSEFQHFMRYFFQVTCASYIPATKPILPSKNSCRGYYWWREYKVSLRQSDNCIDMIRLRACKRTFFTRERNRKKSTDDFLQICIKETRNIVLPNSYFIECMGRMWDLLYLGMHLFHVVVYLMTYSSILSFDFDGTSNLGW